MGIGHSVNASARLALQFPSSTMASSLHDILNSFLIPNPSDEETPFFIDETGQAVSRANARAAVAAALARLRPVVSDTTVLICSNSISFVASFIAAALHFECVVLASEEDAAHSARALGLDHLHVLTAREQGLLTLTDDAMVPALRPHRRLRRIAYFTSGTTGSKKLLAFAPETLHRRLADWTEYFGLPRGATFLCTTTFAHSHGLNLHLLPALALRGTLMAPRLDRLTTGTVAQLLRSRQVSVFTAMPQFLDLLLRSPSAAGLSLADTLVVAGSDALRSSTKLAFEQRFGCQVRDQFGCAETGPVALLHHEDDLRYMGESMTGREVAVLGETASHLQIQVTSRSLCDEIWSDGVANVPTNPYLLADICARNARGLYLRGRDRTVYEDQVSGRSIDLLQAEASLEAQSYCEVVIIPHTCGSVTTLLCIVASTHQLPAADMQACLRESGLSAPADFVCRQALLRTNLGKKVRHAASYGFD